MGAGNKMEDKLKLEIAIKALKKLATPMGAFSRDQLQFARNTIESSVKIAKEALEEIKDKP